MSDQIANVVDAILTAILQWRVKWLEEQKNNPEPPPICRSELKKLKIQYDNYKDYESTFVPLIMHEIWAQIYDDWFRTYRNGSALMDTEDPLPRNCIMKGSLLPREFYIGVADYRTDSQFQCNLQCQALIDSTKVSSHLKLINEGDLVKLDLVSDAVFETNSSGNRIPSSNQNSEYVIDEVNKQTILSLFAYVLDVSAERIGAYTRLADCFHSCRHAYRSHHVVNYQVVIAKRPLRLKTTEFMKIAGLYYLKPMIRQIESVANLKESALASDILCPRMVTCQLALPTVVDIHSEHYNDAQYKAIVGTNEAMMRNMPKIQLLQGPPGTGKTHTLIGIIKHFYTNWRDRSGKIPKILICAPSNGAIDEVARRLYKEREFLKKTGISRSLRMVRVGHPDQISPSVKHISLDELVESNAKHKVENSKKSNLARMNDIENEIGKCDIEISNLRAKRRDREILGVEMKIKELSKQLESFRSNEEIKTRREASESAKRQIRYDLIRNADVILSTLNSCQRHPLDTLFKSSTDLQFHCVIVDEASQCSEPEILMPLCYKISKFILIGDPMQLPATVISKRAQDFDYGRSLFERFFMHFGKYSERSPVAMLTEQYRMHPAICRFPSKQFYDDRLITSRKVDNAYPLKPYVLFDLRHSKETKTSEKTIENEVEASFVRNLITAVVSSAPTNSRIGIITPYKGQKRLLTRKINEVKTERKITIDVDTCDGFQGQEKDIIILSCVRAFDTQSSSIGFLKSFQRINVALTRAKHSLFVCVSAKSLRKDKIWCSLLDDAMDRRAFQSYTLTPSIAILSDMIRNDGSNMMSGRNSSPLILDMNGRVMSENGNFEPEYVIPMDID